MTKETAEAQQAPKKKLDGLVVAFTGTMETMRNVQAKKRAEELGARVTPFVTEKTSYVICGRDPDAKMKEAQALGVPTLTEEQWNKFIGNTVAQQPKPRRPF